jgi:hypothetical protein
MSDLSSAQKAGLITSKEELAIRLSEIGFKEKEALQAFEYTSAIEENTRALEAATAQAVIDSNSPLTSQESKDRASSTMGILNLVKQLSENPAIKGTGVFANGGTTKEAKLALLQYQKSETNQERLKAIKAPFNAEKQIAKDAEALKIQHDRNTLQQEWVKTQGSIITQDLLALSLQEKYSAGYKEELASQRVSLEIKQAELNYSNDSLVITNKEIDLFYKRKNYTLEGFQQKIDELKIEKQLAIEKRNTATVTSEMTKLSAKLTSDLAIQKSYQDLIIANANNQLAIDNFSRDIETTKLNQMKEQGAISEELYNSKAKQIALDRVQQEYDAKALANTLEQKTAAAEYNRLLVEAQALAGKTAVANMSPESRSSTTDVYNSAASGASVSAQASSAYSDTQSKLAGVADLNKKNLDYQKQQIELQYTYLDLLKQQADVQKGLTTIFGDMGTKVYSVVKAFSSLQGKSSKDDAAVKAQKDKMALLEKTAKIQTAAGISDSEFDAERKDNAEKLGQLESDNTVNKIDGIGAIAGATKDMFEKGSKASKAMAAVEKASAMITTGAAISKLVSQSGWFGFAGAAALIALLSTFGITGGGVPAGMDAESKQKVQGTGQSYNSNGELVANGTGKLGDVNARSTTIKDGLDLLNKTNFEMLDFGKNETYKALVAIKNNTENFVKSLATTSGITGGISPFGTSEVGSKGFLGIGSTTHSIVDTGIKVLGSIQQLMAGGGIKQQYETVHNTNSGFFGFGSSSSTDVNTKALPSNVDNYIKGILQGFSNTLLSAASVLGTSSNAVQTALDSFNFTLNVSAKGMTGQEFADAVMAQIGLQLDAAANLAFPNLKVLADQFQHFGESSADFVLRLVNDTKNITLAMQSIGKPIDTSQITQISELLVTASGGLDAFISSTKNFSDKFLSESEKLAPISAAVSAEFAKLNITMPDTREGFKQLILGFKITDQKSADTYNSLLDLATAFDQLHPAIIKTLSDLDLQKAKLTQQIDIYNLEGKSSEALTMQRKDELAQMDERLRAGQLYIYALQDEATLKGQLKTAYDSESAALTSTINTLGSGVKTLNAYKLSLNMGAQSNLSPQEKYAQAKSQAESVAAIANSIVDTTKSKDQQALDTQAKNDAINQLPTVSAAFLDASRAIYASSSMYNQDYSYIQDLINTTTATLGNQQTDAQLQLDQLKTQVGALIDINANIATTNDILTRLEIAQQNINATQPGAAASGLIVGNITNTSTPIESLFSQLTQKVKDLSDEIAGLRADQQAQTQDIVVSNATTQSVAADTVVTGVTNAINTSNWRYNNTPMLK